jgi:hypothetical protein
LPAGSEDGRYGFIEAAGVALQEAVVHAAGSIVVQVGYELVITFEG